MVPRYRSCERVGVDHFTLGVGRPDEVGNGLPIAIPRTGTRTRRRPTLQAAFGGVDFDRGNCMGQLLLSGREGVFDVDFIGSAACRRHVLLSVYDAGPAAVLASHPSVSSTTWTERAWSSLTSSLSRRVFSNQGR